MWQFFPLGLSACAAVVANPRTSASRRQFSQVSFMILVQPCWRIILV